MAVARRGVEGGGIRSWRGARMWWQWRKVVDGGGGCHLQALLPTPYPAGQVAPVRPTEGGRCPQHPTFGPVPGRRWGGVVDGGTPSSPARVYLLAPFQVPLRVCVPLFDNPCLISKECSPIARSRIRALSHYL